MSEQGAKPEVLPGDLITRPGLYESRGGDIVRITGWDEGWWVSEWDGRRDWYGSDGRQRFNEGLEPNRWQLLHWVGPLPTSEVEPETTSEQLAEIEGQADTIEVREGRWRTRGGDIRNVTPTPEGDGRGERWPWWDAHCKQTWRADGRCYLAAESVLDLVTYLGPIEPDKTQELPADYTPPEGWRLVGARETLTLGDEIVQSDDGRRYPTERVGDIVGANQRYIRRIEQQPQPEPQPVPVQVREGRWKTRGEQEVRVTAMPTDREDFSPAYPWWDGEVTTWTDDGVFFRGAALPKDLVEYLGPIEPEPQPQPQPQPQPEPQREAQPEPEPEPPMLQDADQRIRLLRYANDTQAGTILLLQGEVRDLNIEMGGLERQLVQRDARIRDLETLHDAISQAVVDAGKQNDALRLQAKNRQEEYQKQTDRIGFLETLNAGNGAAISDYRAKVEKLQGLVDTARGQLEAAATERDELRAAIDQSDKQLDQKDAQIRDLRIELDAAQQVPRPVSDEERERIWDDATEQAGRQVIRWLRPLTLALGRQPDERFSRFMALTLSILPDVVPELLGYAVEDGAEGDCEE